MRNANAKLMNYTFINHFKIIGSREAKLRSRSHSFELFFILATKLSSAYDSYLLIHYKSILSNHD
jgi:hypothetical protein